MAISSVSACLMILVLCSLLSQSQGDCGSFSFSCTTPVLRGTILMANCLATSGSSGMSHVDLNKCIANLNGKLVSMKDGNFGASCTRIQLIGNSILIASCKIISGALVNAQYDLNKSISNNQAQLSCNFC